ncbi:MAG TPA: DUF5666 domain-containing protein [Candidatus Angelobacter sp.]|jgi:hypothetical protein|nr:DUF5666 domain-containing protein [Candidatus Angelobacter sp.]
MRKLPLPRKLQSFAHTLLLSCLSFAAGCGAGNLQPTSSQPPQPAAATSTQLRIGDAPADKVFSFEITLGSSISMAPANGGAASVITISANRLELSHTAAKLEPLVLTNLKPGNYSSADITIQSPSITYTKLLFMPEPVTLIDRFTGNDQSVHVTFDPPLVIGSAPLVLNLDVDTADALIMDGGGNIVGTNFKPNSITFSTQPVGPATNQQDDDGEIEDETGKIVEVSSSGFVLATGQSGARLPFTVDATSELPPGLALPNLLNRLVKVEGFTSSNGVLFAKEVEILGDQNASQLEGIVWQVGSFNNPSLVAMSAQDGTGAGITVTQVGQDFLMDISTLPNASFSVDFGNCGMAPAGDPSLVFDSTHLKAGQRLEVITETGVSETQSILPQQVRLQQQAVSGTVTNIATMPGGLASFDLALPADSFLTLLSGASRVHVLQQPRTDNRFGALSEGAPVRVRGALLWTGTQFTMVARRITQ